MNAFLFIGISLLTLIGIIVCIKIYEKFVDDYGDGMDEENENND